MNIGHHHQTLRKKTLSRSGSQSKYVIKVVDTCTYIGSLLSILFTLDQVRIIWIDRITDGVSLIAWSVFTFSAVMWFFYGLLHKDKIVTITNFFWVFFSVLVVVGLVMYR